MDQGQPDWLEFEKVARGAMREVHAKQPAADLRAYGEMVGILWKARQFAAAIRLEQLWNRLLEQSSFSLYCAYAIDLFGEDFDAVRLDGILCTHTHVLPTTLDGSLEKALHLAMKEILGADAENVDLLIKGTDRPVWAVVPTAENTVLWLKRHLPQHVEGIVARARFHHHQMTSATCSM